MLGQIAIGLATTAALGLTGWFYTTAQRVTVVETRLSAEEQAVKDIRSDIRDLRNALLGPKKEVPRAE